MLSPTNQDLSNDTTFSQIKSRVPVPLNMDSTAKSTLSFYYFYLSKIFLGRVDMRNNKEHIEDL